MKKIKKEVTQKFIKLETIRKRYKLKQEDFGVLLGITKSSYSQKENGKTPFTYNEITLLLWALNKKANDNGDDPLTFEDVFLKEKWQISNKKIMLLDYKDKYMNWFNNLPEHEKLSEIRNLLGIGYLNKDSKQI